MLLHLQRLKKRLLAPEQVAQTRFDDRLEAIAEGVQSAFEGFTGRLFARAASVVEDLPGGATLYNVTRYPLESVSSVTVIVEVTGTPDAQTIAHLSKSSGQILLGAAAGTEFDTVRITYTGGYWIDTSEFGDGEQPAGSTALPEDLLRAWVTQIDHECRVRKLFGGTTAEDMAAALPNDFDFLPVVQHVLRRYMRLQ